MKILFITNYFPPHYFGGYELKCRQISQLLVERGHEALILSGTYTGPGAVGNPPEEPGILRVLDYDQPEDSFWKRAGIERKNYVITEDAVERFQPDLIYLWNQRGLTLGPSLAASASGLPHMFQMGDFWPNTYIKPGRKARFFRILHDLLPFTVKGTLNFSPAIVVGGWMAKEMKEKFGTTIAHHVPRGVSIPPAPDEKKLLATTHRFLYSGRVDPEKGVDVAIRALAWLHRQGDLTEFEFNIVGGGEPACLRECQRLVEENGLTGHVHFLGKTREMTPYYESHSILLMPTLMREAFGIVIIEAMCHGMIPVVSDGYGPREIVTHGEDGLRFEPGNFSALADNLLLLIHDPERRVRIGRAARQTVESRYTLEQEIGRVESLLLDQAGLAP